MNPASNQLQQDPPAPSELSFADALQMAVQLQRNQQLEGAIELYRRLLAAAPGHPDVLHLLGMALYQMGQAEQGVSLIEQAIEAQPDYAGFHNNLANICSSLGRIDRARASYLHAIALDPNQADFRNNLGVLYRVTDEPEQAEAEYQRAIELDPAHYRAHNNLGLLAAARGDVEAAVRHYCTSITLRPQQDDGHKLLGMAFYLLGRFDEATEVYRKWLANDPENPVARHHLAACSGAEAPERASDDYVERTFDVFAASFEEQLQNRLSYRAPELVAAALGRVLPESEAQLDVLDIGCGTGLCGPLLRPWAARLTGVDLSVGMLRQADAKGCYDRLFKIELTEFLLKPEQAGAWDLIQSADTLCYFGPLEAVFAAAHRALRPGGWLAFSVEDAGDAAPGHILNPHGRYSHSRSYLERCLGESGFDCIKTEPVTLRTEAGKPVAGWVVVGKNGTAAGSRY